MKRAQLRKLRAAARIARLAGPPRKPRPLGVSLARYTSWIAMLGALAAGVSTSRAVTYTFDASTTTGIGEGAGLWDTTTPLWTTDGGLTNLNFVSGTGNSVIFGGGVSGGAGTVALGSALSVGRITLNAPYGGTYTLTGGASNFLLSVNDGLTIHTAAAITGNIKLTADQTWLNDSAGLLTDSGTIDNNGFLLTISNLAAGGQTLSGVISGLGGLTVNSTGAGVTTIGAATANTFSGPTLVQSGTLVASTAGSLGSVTNVTLGTAGVLSPLAPTLNASVASVFNTNAVVTLATNTAVLNLAAGANQTISTLNGVGTVTLLANTLTLGGNADASFGTASVSTLGSITGTAVAPAVNISKGGTGVFTLGGNNTYTGQFNVTAGTLKLASANALGTAAGATVLTTGAMLDLGGFSTADPLTLVGTGILGQGALINSGAGVSTASGAITLSGATTIGGTGQIIFSTGVFDVGGAAALTKLGSSYAIFQGPATTRTGTTTVSAGTLRLIAASGTTNPLSSGAITIDTTGVLSLAPTTASGNLAVDTNFNVTGVNAAGFTGNTVLTDSGAVQGLRNLTFGAGTTALTLAAGPVLAINTASGATFTGTITLPTSGTPTNTTLTTINNGTGLETLTLGAVAGGATVRTITKEGGGNVTFNTAGATLANGSSLVVNRGSVISSAATSLGANLAIQVNNNALLTFNTAAQTIASLTGAGTVSIATAAVPLTIGDAQNLSSTFTGVFANAGGITKAGTGTLTLNGPNGGSGAILLNAGTILAQDLGAALGAGALTLSAGTLDLRANASNAFGNTALNITGTTTINVQNNGAGTNNTLTLTGGLSMGATQINVTGANGTWLNIGPGVASAVGAPNNNPAQTLASIPQGLVVGGLFNGQTVTAITGNVVTLGGNGAATVNNAPIGFGNSAIVLTAGTTPIFNVNTGTTLLLSGSTTATTGGFNKQGAGLLVLSGTNLHTGTDTLTSGTIRGLTAGAFGAAGTGLILNGGFVELFNNVATTFTNTNTTVGNTFSSTITADIFTGMTGIPGFGSGYSNQQPIGTPTITHTLG
ncbi:MAG TPA: autotransporter-associated beta strand repeat-containing protein, partial [Chthoniobacteraceae bacterium]|nr:autotransporter-associated beta strand repeat-containing protein [Chthoniobacteraceae bacterium]